MFSRVVWSPLPVPCGVPEIPGSRPQVGKMPNLGTTAPSKVMLQQNPDGAQPAGEPTKNAKDKAESSNMLCFATGSVEFVCFCGQMWAAPLQVPSFCVRQRGTLLWKPGCSTLTLEEAGMWSGGNQSSFRWTTFFWRLQTSEQFSVYPRNWSWSGIHFLNALY